MTTLIEGTLEEVKRRLNELTIPANTHLQVLMEEEPIGESSAEEFINSLEIHNGIRLLPMPSATTLEQVKALSEE